MKPGEYILLNAFTGNHALGNQACVLMLDDISDTKLLHSIAQNFNMPATTFLRKRPDRYDVRWFAPDAEIGLCGHGTIAATWALTQIEADQVPIQFHYGQGVLIGEKGQETVSISADAIVSNSTDIPDHVQRGFQGQVVEYETSPNKHLVLLKDEKAVREMKPNWAALRESETFGYVITAKGSDQDCVSRVILPYVSFLEDQATGSAHMLLASFWSKRLNKSSIHAFQASQRGGEMRCDLSGSEVRLTAKAVPFGAGKLL